MAAYGERFYRPGDRKLTLNFALANGMPVDPDVLLRYFDPERYLIKITPVNPTYRAQQNELASYIDPQKHGEQNEIAARLEEQGYEVIISIGEIEENQIGSNCGQYVLNYLKGKTRIKNGYTYQVQKHALNEVIS
jgi:23S rRNA (adenine2503-C2)-methyltransferase